MRHESRTALLHWFERTLAAQGPTASRKCQHRPTTLGATRFRACWPRVEMPWLVTGASPSEPQSGDAGLDTKRGGDAIVVSLAQHRTAVDTHARSHTLATADASACCEIDMCAFPSVSSGHARNPSGSATAAAPPQANSSPWRKRDRTEPRFVCILRAVATEAWTPGRRLARFGVTGSRPTISTCSVPIMRFCTSCPSD